MTAREDIVHQKQRWLRIVTEGFSILNDEKLYGNSTLVLGTIPAILGKHENSNARVTRSQGIAVTLCRYGVKPRTGTQ